MAIRIKPAGLIVCGLLLLWLGWLNLDRRVSDAEDTASSASYAASDASYKADEAKREAEEAKSIAEEAGQRSRYFSY